MHASAPAADTETAIPGIVTVTAGGIEHASAERIDVRAGGIAIARADGPISVRAGGIAVARAPRVEVGVGQVVIALADELRVRLASLSLAAARVVHIERSLVQTVVAQRVRIEGRSPVLIVIARTVEGEVRPLLDWRGALAAGAVVAFAQLVLRGRRRSG
ncbi:MAG: hypothetical protein ACKOTZ_11900 [Chloroflexota bacterium]